MGLSSSPSHKGHYALVLGERHGNRRLPIIIGGAEAQAIALELEKIKPNRPMTHDLIYNLFKNFEVELKEVIINDLDEGIFYALLIMQNSGEAYHIDCRPSDAIAIGVRFKVPIYTYERILEDAGIVIESEEEESDYTDESGEFSLAQVEKSDLEDEDTEEPEYEQPPAKSSKGKMTDTDRITELEQQLNSALGNEDYEKAAELRDAIQKLKDK